MENDICIFLCGDVMTGRGIDQILPYPSQPQLYESFVSNARDYVALAEAVNGKIHYPVTMDYIWGDALSIWQSVKPDVKIINLETAITQSEDAYDKGINYRMHPLNIDIFKTAGIDICTLANNHILDWGYAGLSETLMTLSKAEIQFAGAGETLAQAMQPVIFNLDSNKRVLVFAAGMASSGVPLLWEATHYRPGVYYLADLNQEVLGMIAKHIKHFKQLNDIVIFSLHWGSNWGYDISTSFRSFAHGLIEETGVDVVYGHSSHHPRPIEIYQDKPILYGCGDFINDYEGISGYDEYRGDLTFMYFLHFDRASLQFKHMTLIPLQMKKLSLHLTNKADSQWLENLLKQSWDAESYVKISTGIIK